MEAFGGMIATVDWGLWFGFSLRLRNCEVVSVVFVISNGTLVFCNLYVELLRNL